MLEIILKLFAFGFIWLKDCWNLLDAFVVVFCFILGFLESLDGGQMLALGRLARLRGFLRLFRIAMVVSKLTQHKQAMIGLKRNVFHKLEDWKYESPVERIIECLQDVKSSTYAQAKPSVAAEILFAIEIIKSRKLYEVDLAGDAEAAVSAVYSSGAARVCARITDEGSSPRRGARDLTMI